jgi:hypothetical protein
VRRFMQKHEKIEKNNHYEDWNVDNGLTTPTMKNVTLLRKSTEFYKSWFENEEKVILSK